MKIESLMNSQGTYIPLGGVFTVILKTSLKLQEVLFLKIGNIGGTIWRRLSTLIFSSTRVVLPIFIALFLYGCGGRPNIPVYEPSGQPVYPETGVPDMKDNQPPPKADMLSGPAAPLHQKAQVLLSQKDYRQAELVMERALRIEPKNGYYWYTLAKIASAQKQIGRTVQLCLKSKSLARGDARLIQLNDHLIGR